MRMLSAFLPAAVGAALLLSGCAETGAVSSAQAEDSEEETAADEEYTMKELRIPEGDTNIYGRLYLPGEDEGNSLVILSHGFGGTYRNTEDYAEYFAENGIAAFAFDFIGGGSGSRSGGSTTEMSVLTEASDLNTVLDYFRSDPDYDNSHIFLMGESQGGFVSTYVAGTRPEDVAGLIALYPAYVLQDDSRERNPDPGSGPDEGSIMGVPIGRIYDEDAQSFDIYDVMKNYTGKVLLVHGTADSIVPLSYSERAAHTFPDAQLVTIDGAGHGFYGQAKKEAQERALQFVQQILEAPAESRGDGMNMTIGNTPVQVQWEDNESVQALKGLAGDGPLTISMSMYGGFEQVGSIGQALPRSDVQTSTSAGDIVLYKGDHLVIFYGTNSWAYTRLGKITDQTAEELAQLLGNGDVTVTISERKQ